MSDDTAALILRLRAHERDARQQCQCRSDRPNCVACDCGAAAAEIERLRAYTDQVLRANDTLSSAKLALMARIARARKAT